MKSQLSRVIGNPHIGEEVTIIESTEETNGKYLRFKFVLNPHFGIFLHYHLDLVEHFEIIEGEVEFTLGREKVVLRKGESISIPEKTIHRFWNHTDEFVTMMVELRPVKTFESFMRASYGLDTDGKSWRISVFGYHIPSTFFMPNNILLLGTLFQMGEFYVPVVPRFVQRAIFGFMAYLAKITGSDKQLEKYYKI